MKWKRQQTVISTDKMVCVPVGFLYGFYGKIISLILSRVKRYVERKWEIPEKNHQTTCKQNLACLTYDPS